MSEAVITPGLIHCDTIVEALFVSAVDLFFLFICFVILCCFEDVLCVFLTYNLFNGFIL